MMNLGIGLSSFKYWAILSCSWKTFREGTLPENNTPEKEKIPMGKTHHFLGATGMLDLGSV